MFQRLILLLSGMSALFGGTAAAAVTPVWSTGVAVPGEKVVLYLIDSEVEEDYFSLPMRPSVQHARLEIMQPQAAANPLAPDRSSAEVYPLLLTPDAPGELRVGDVEVEYSSGRREKVSIPPLPVLSTSEIRWKNSPVPYGVLWYTDTKDAYTDQPVHACMKVFLPGDCETPFAPQLHAVGVRISAFQPTLQGVAAMMQAHILNPTVAYAKGQTWRTTEFSGLLTPFRDGNSDIGGKLTIVQRQGFFNSGRAEVDIPVLRLGSMPLPPGAPADFVHAVGQFSISAATQASSLAMNEAVEVEITVRGTGDLAQLPCPEPTEPEAWKLVPATRKPLLGPNGETVGMVFSRLMRPTAEVRGIPSFAFSYFDPQSLEYKRATTAPLPLTWRKSDTAGSGLAVSAAEPPPAGKVPVAEMTDIYGYLTPDLYGNPCPLPRALLLLLYLPALIVLGRSAWSTLSRRYAAGAAARAQERELAALSQAPTALDFLKAIGSYIESHVAPEHRSPELQRILDRRDDEAFRPEAGTSLTPDERRDMLKALRKVLAHAAGTAMLLLLTLLPTIQAAGEAEKNYAAGQYSHALQWLEQSPVPEGEEALVLYNKGNCEYRLGNEGRAALLYAQALLRDPGFAEAKANLAFIQRKQGAILPQYLTEDEIFTYLTPSQLALITVCCTALAAFLLALMFTRRNTPTPRLNALTWFSLVLVLLCGTGHLYNATRQVPNPAATAPEDTAMVITATAARASADSQGAVVIELPVSSPLHVLAQRGDWCYVETFANGTRGWVPTKAVAILRDGRKPSAPILLRL